MSAHTQTPTSESGRGAAFFDMNGTVVPAAANVPLAAAALRWGWLSPQGVVRDLRSGALYILRGVGEERTANIRDQVMTALRGRAVDEFATLVGEIAPALAGSVPAPMRRLLDQHIIEGRDRILLSSSPTEMVAGVASLLGLEGGVGTTPEVDAGGVYTGRIAGPFCFGEGKAEVMRSIAQERGYDLASSYAYSDSITDRPMLEAVGHPVAVNPDPALRALAEDRRWPILQTSRFQRFALADPNAWLRMSQRLLVASVAAAVSMGTRPVEYFGDLFDVDEDDEVAMAG